MLWPIIQLSDRQPSETAAPTLEKTASITSSINEIKTALRISYLPLLVIATMVIIIGFIFLRAKGRKASFEVVSRHVFGYRPLDLLLKEGIPEGYSIILSSMPCDQKDDAIKGFLRAGLDEGSTAVYITNTVDKVLELVKAPKMYVLICNPQADEIAPPTGNVEKVKTIENLTDVNISIIRLIEKLYEESQREGQSKAIRICLDNLDDVLIQHKGSTTRKWLLELIPRLKRTCGIILATVNPRMHPKEDLNAILSIFQGQIDILEGTKRGRLYRKILVSRMYNVYYSKKGFKI
ncbi:MAG: hypothetical protein QXE79_07880 [Candidatus Bathyarchaeia archaeon]